ncbi:hypothetical protein [Pandoraea terrae]|nr:hypothetical protein [Pandoraea terrae]
MRLLLTLLVLLLCVLLFEEAWLPSAQADECGDLAPAQTLQCAAGLGTGE